ncbi:FAD/NAD(P)-binding protein [Amycolatopsis minnesotensis]|uniref:FAD/NAD(P)-binding protein n=1 Tax=Amycolatopsis minnesotensis TaxID=337894 RepID=A0ABN2Q2W9_9PSEU
MTAELRIGLIGAGPRGTSVLERLLANVDGQPVSVHVVDEFPPGPGRVWRTRQHEGLLMNTVASQVSMFTDESVPCAGPIVRGPSLHEWATQVAAGAFPGACPDGVRAEARGLGPDDYPTRAFYGHYLRWVFDRLRRGAPPCVRITVHTTAAVALDDTRDGRQVIVLRDGSTLAGLDAVVLAVGHGPLTGGGERERLARFARTHGLTYVAQANPADVDLSVLEPGERVALRGLGLTFFDYLHLLTEGRGGVFERAAGGLRYRPSGREPRLIAGSRRGVPYHARGENQKGPFGRHVPLFLTGAVIDDLRRRAAAGHPPDFRGTVWPLVDLEVKAVYYRTLVASAVSEEAARRFLEEFVRTRDEEPGLRRHGIAERWDWARIESPYGARTFDDSDEFAVWLLGYLREDVREARLGNVASPLKAALDVLRDLRNEVRLVVDHGGIDGGSYRDELERWYNPLNAFTSIGPPVRRIEEMIALVEAGVLRLTGPGMTVAPSAWDGCFLVGSGTADPGVEPVTGLIEARLPEVDLRRSDNPLLRYLLATGLCQPYRMRDGEAGCYESGGLAVTGRPYRVVDRRGRPHPARFAFGIPTEGVHWVTAAGIRPGVGSVTLEDADAIARAALDCCLPRENRRGTDDGQRSPRPGVGRDPDRIGGRR